MYQYHCLNPISPVEWVRNWMQIMKRQKMLQNADAILVRSAKMHEMEFGEKLRSDRTCRCRCEQYPAGSLCGARNRCI